MKQMLRIAVVCQSFLTAGAIFGQIGETHYFDKWRLSEGIMLKFDGGLMPVVSSDSMPFQDGPNHMICNPLTGELLFTTTGYGIYDRYGQFMPNAGDFLAGSPRAIIPHPGNQDLFYVLSWDETIAGRIAYSVVDMSLNGGLGDVVAGQKRIGFGPLVTQSMKAFSDPSGLRHWLVAHEQYSSDFVVFSISNQLGLDTVPVRYTVPPAVGGVYTFYLQALTVSGDRLAARAQPSNGTWLYTLDPFNGTITGGMQLPTQPRDHLMEFSPSGQYLYTTPQGATGAPLYQFDLGAGDVSAIMGSMYAFPEISTFGTNGGSQLRLGPDGRLWIRPPGTLWGSSHLAWLENPDAQGATAGLDSTGLDLNYTFINSVFLPWTFWPYAPLVGIPNHTATKPTIELQAVPNPASTTCTFIVKGGLNGGQLRIFDITGKLVQQERITGNRSLIDVSELSPGIYVAQLVSNTGVHQAMARWVKE